MRKISMVLVCLMFQCYPVFANDEFLPQEVNDSFLQSKILSNSTSPGTIIDTRKLDYKSVSSIKSSLDLPSLNLDIQQITFATTDSIGRKVKASATLLLPDNPTQETKILEYNPWIDSLGTYCNPSYLYSNFYRDFLTWQQITSFRTPLDFMKHIQDTNKNYAVLIPDDLGLNNAFGANYLGAHIGLDALRAVKHFRSYFKNLKSLVYGYSGGGMVTAWEAALEKDYAPDLEENVSWYVAGGIPSNLYNLATYYNAFSKEKKRGFGLVTALVVGITRDYPTFNLTDLLNSDGQNSASALKDSCIAPIMFHELNKSGYDFFQDPTGTNMNSLISLINDNSLSKVSYTPYKPITIVYADNDTVIPQNDTLKLAKKWQESNSNIYLKELKGDHGAFNDTQVEWVIDKMNDIFG